MCEKNDRDLANEAGQKDGSTDDWYKGWAHGDDQDAYNAGYDNGRDNPASEDSDD